MEVYELVRRLYVKSGIDVVDFTDKDTFGAEITGLGVEFEIETQERNGCLVVKNRQIRQNPVKMRLYLGAISHKPYEKFREVAHTLLGPGLKLEYVIPGVGAYTKDVSLARLEKTEIEKDGTLTCDLEFISKTPWYEDQILVSMDESPYQDVYFQSWQIRGYNYTKKYPYVYEYKGYSEMEFDQSTSRGVYNLKYKDDMSSLLTLGAPLIFEWKATEETGDITDGVEMRIMTNGWDQYAFRWTGTIPKGSRLYVNSDPNEYCVYLIDSQGRHTDVSDKIDTRYDAGLYAHDGFSQIIFSVRGFTQREYPKNGFSLRLRKYWAVV